VVPVADGDQAIPPDAERQSPTTLPWFPRLERMTTYAAAVAGQSQL
jgi:hypothetical protein